MMKDYIFLHKINGLISKTNCNFTNGKVYDDVNDYTNSERWIGGPWDGYQPEVGQLIISDII